MDVEKTIILGTWTSATVWWCVYRWRCEQHLFKTDPLPKGIAQPMLDVYDSPVYKSTLERIQGFFCTLYDNWWENRSAPVFTLRAQCSVASLMKRWSSWFHNLYVSTTNTTEVPPGQFWDRTGSYSACVRLNGLKIKNKKTQSSCSRLGPK